jgi:hypothetical protein
MRIHVWTAAVLLSGAAVSARASEEPGLAELLERVGKYALRYEEEFKDLAAEETYMQKLFVHRNLRVQQVRTLKSDMVFVKFEGEHKWMAFRDVFEADGKLVRERKARLERLFQRVGNAAYGRAQQILEESARYNLGRMSRNFNLPMLALVFLDPENQSRFDFKKKGEDKIAGLLAAEIEYEEKDRPAFIRDGNGKDLFSKGSVWVDVNDGRLFRSELKVQDADGSYKVEISVEFAPWQEGGIWVPRQMQETCATIPLSADRMPGLRGSPGAEARGVDQGLSLQNVTHAGEYLEAVATYSGYRNFRDAAPALP